jgi:hypothetical protein
MLWNGPSIGMLQRLDGFVNGGWWHDAHILAATGEGVDREESKGWSGWWNEQIVPRLLHIWYIEETC